MEMIARIRAVVEVPFEYDVGEPDETGFAAGRSEAAQHAADTVFLQVKEALKNSGVLLEDLTLIEEVREADLS